MRKLHIILLALILLPLVIFTALSYHYYEAIWNALPYFLYELLWRTLFVASLSLLLWRWIFKKNTSLGFFCFALLFSCFILCKSVEMTKELDRKAQSVAAMELIANSWEKCVGSEEFMSLKSKEYTIDRYGELTPAVIYSRNYFIFSKEEEQKRAMIEQELNFKELLSADLLCSREKIIESRKKLVACYHKTKALQNQSLNYHSNLFRIFKNSSGINEVVKASLEDIFKQRSARTCDFSYDLYNNLISRIYVADDLLIFLLNRHGLYTCKDRSLTFDSDIDIARYNAFIEEYNHLSDIESQIVNRFNEES
jgi:hypothetical protein